MDHRLIMRFAGDPLYRNSLLLMFTNFFNSGCGFFFWIIAAKIYTVEEVGLATALISFLGLAILVSRLGFDFSIIRFLSTNDKARVFGTCLSITTMASILVGAICILLVEFFSSSLAFLKDPVFALAFLLIVVINSVAAITGNAFVADRKADKYLFQNIFMAFRILFLGPLAFLGTFGIFGSVGLSYLLASFFALIVLQKSVASIWLRVDADFLKKSFRFSNWNYASSILSAAPTLILPLMVLNLLGEEEAAKYYIAFAIGNLIIIIPYSLGTSLFVEGSHGEGLRKSVARSAGASLILMVPIVLAIFLLGDRLLGLLNEDYIEAFNFLRIMAASGFLLIAYYLFIPIQNVRMKVGSILKLNALRFILLLVLSYVLMQQYGIMGAGYGWVITYGIINIAIVWQARIEGWI